MHRGSLTAHETAAGLEPPRIEVSVMLVRALASVLLQRGLRLEELLDHELPALNADPCVGRVSMSEYQALLARASLRTGDPALGLACGLQAAESSFGLVNALVTHAPSLRLALELLSRFHPLLLDGVRVSLTERLGVATLRCEFPRLGPSLERSFAEMIVAGIERMLRVFGSTRESVHAVCFEHERPTHHQAYAAAFGGVERFGHGFTGVVFAAEILDRAHAYADPALESLLCSEAQRRLEQVRRPAKCGERVLAIMRTQPQGEPIVAERVARELGISVRSLRRHLLDEGTSFRALAQSVLQETACAMLQERELTIKAIADEMGFADATAFHRAFKRWMQLTPCEYRARLHWAPEPHLAVASSA